MFNIKDKVVYGETGVCLIEDICEKEFIKNQKKKYYVLKPISSSGNLIYSPIENNKIPMRNIISKRDAEILMQSIPNIAENIQGFTEFTVDDYKNEILSQNPKKLVELITQIYNKKKTVQIQKKRFNAIDEKYMKITENLLFGELSEALEIDINEVRNYVLKIIQT